MYALAPAGSVGGLPFTVLFQLRLDLRVRLCFFVLDPLSSAEYELKNPPVPRIVKHCRQWAMYPVRFIRASSFQPPIKKSHSTCGPSRRVDSVSFDEWKCTGSFPCIYPSHTPRSSSVTSTCLPQPSEKRCKNFTAHTQSCK